MDREQLQQIMRENLAACPQVKPAAGPSIPEATIPRHVSDAADALIQALPDKVREAAAQGSSAVPVLALHRFPRNALYGDLKQFGERHLGFLSGYASVLVQTEKRIDGGFVVETRRVPLIDQLGEHTIACPVGHLVFARLAADGLQPFLLPDGWITTKKPRTIETASGPVVSVRLHIAHMVITVDLDDHHRAGTLRSWRELAATNTNLCPACGKPLSLTDRFRRRRRHVVCEESADDSLLRPADVPVLLRPAEEPRQQGPPAPY